MQIPKSILAPFGYTGVPVFCREDLEDELAKAIQELADEMDRMGKEDRDRYITIMNPFVREAIFAIRIDPETGHKWPY
jgi:hypothetical protein